MSFVMYVVWILTIGFRIKKTWLTMFKHRVNRVFQYCKPVVTIPAVEVSKTLWTEKTACSDGGHHGS